METPSRTVTFLFTDIEGSTKLLEQLRDQYTLLLEEHEQILRTTFTRWSGHEIDTQGDAFFVAFPRALDAVHRVIEVQRSLIAHLVEAVQRQPFLAVIGASDNGKSSVLMAHACGTPTSRT